MASYHQITFTRNQLEVSNVIDCAFKTDLTCLNNTKWCLKTENCKLLPTFERSFDYHFEKYFSTNFPFILINAVNSSISAFQPREPNLTHEHVSNWYVISDCSFTKHLLLMLLQQTNCCFVVHKTCCIDWCSTVTILYVCWSTMLQ